MVVAEVIILGFAGWQAIKIGAGAYLYSRYGGENMCGAKPDIDEEEEEKEKEGERKGRGSTERAVMMREWSRKEELEQRRDGGRDHGGSE